MHKWLNFFSENPSNSTTPYQSDPEHNWGLALKVIVIFMLLPSLLTCVARCFCQDLPPLPDLRREVEPDTIDDEFEVKAQECDVAPPELKEIELGRIPLKANVL